MEELDPESGDMDIKEEVVSSPEPEEHDDSDMEEENSLGDGDGNSDPEGSAAADGDDDDGVPSGCKRKKSKDEKKKLAGIIYLSTIPPGMNVKTIREYFAQFGEINRSFLQPEDKGWRSKLNKSKKVKNQKFVEGWIEFKKRRHAKRVAATINNTPVGGKKSKPYHDFLWNIKYLKGFRWSHLTERLNYERISKQQKLRAEISAAKRETSYFAKSVDLSNKLKKRRKAEGNVGSS